MSGTDIVQRTPAQQLVLRVRGDDFKQQVAMALPPAVTPERFVRVAATAVMTNPDIAKLNHDSVLRAMVQCAADGLMPDGREAALVKRGDNAVYTPMIGGFRKKAAEHGWTIRTAVVYENDAFEHVVEDAEEKILHRPVRPGDDRGELVAAYAIAKHVDGRKVVTVLHPEDIKKRRSKATTQKVWDEFPAAMWEKSAGRDLFGQLGLAEGDAAVQRMLAAEALAHGEAATALYGPPPVGGGDGASTTRDTSGTAGAVDRQQAEPAAALETPAAGSVPDPDHEFVDVDEIEFAPEVDLQELAAKAADYVVPSGRTWKGKTLQEVFDAGENGVAWFKLALEQVTVERGHPVEFQDAVRDFARVHLPDEYAAATEPQAEAA